MSSWEIERATLAFYRELFAHSDAASAWRAMNHAISATETVFKVFTAEYTFRWIYYEYLTQLCNKEALSKRQERMIAQFVEAGSAQDGLEATSQQLQCAQAVVGAYLSDHQSHFARIRDRFFFVDLFPGNATRFGLSFDDRCRDPRSEASTL